MMAIIANRMAQSTSSKCAANPASILVITNLVLLYLPLSTGERGR
jgi:hypothetical protein